MSTGIGGNLGLFIGISGVTILEWVEFFFIALATYTCCATGVPLWHDDKAAKKHDGVVEEHSAAATTADGVAMGPASQFSEA